MEYENKLSFKKSDFLNYEQLAKQFDVSPEEVLSVMKRHYKANTPISYQKGIKKINSVLIIKERGNNKRLNDAGCLLLHPMGMNRFRELLLADLTKSK